MAGSHTKQSETLNDLLTKVIALRRTMPKEYEIKLRKLYANRAEQMKNGIFDGNKLPEINLETEALHQNLSKNRELMGKAQHNADQYLFAKEMSQQLNDELNDMVESLQKVAEIEKTMRN